MVLERSHEGVGANEHGSVGDGVCRARRRDDAAEEAARTKGDSSFSHVCKEGIVSRRQTLLVMTVDHYNYAVNFLQWIYYT